MPATVFLFRHLHRSDYDHRSVTETWKIKVTDLWF